MSTHAIVRTLAACCTLALAGAAQAGPTDSYSYGILSDGRILPQPLVSEFHVHQTAPGTIRFVRIQGALHRQSASSTLAPRNQVIYLSNDTVGSTPVSLSPNNLDVFPVGGIVNVDLFARLPAPVVAPDSYWLVGARSLEDTDPNGWEANWQSITVTLNDGAPANVTDLGTLTPGAVSKSPPLALHETKWFRFTLPVSLNIALGHFLDIDTEGSALAPVTNDTEIALYNEDGIRVGYDDDDGTGALSQLTFGGGVRPGPLGALAYNGRDGSLAAGTYYLGVRGYEASAPNAVGWDFSNTNASIRSGDIRVTIRTNVGQQIGCPADFNHDGTLQVQDVFDYLNAWFGGCP